MTPNKTRQAKYRHTLTSRGLTTITLIVPIHARQLFFDLAAKLRSEAPDDSADNTIAGLPSAATDKELPQ